MNRVLQSTQEEGASAVEFAIILPLMVTLVFGMIEFSILFYNKAMITNASREGARAGIVYNFPNRVSDADITNVVNNYCSSNLITFGSASGPNTAITRSGSGSAAGDALSVTVSYHYDYLVLPNFIGALVAGTDLAATTVMRLE